MTELFKKLNFKGQSRIFSINHPVSFEMELKDMGRYTRVETNPGDHSEIEYSIVFVKRQDEIEKFIIQKK